MGSGYPDSTQRGSPSHVPCYPHQQVSTLSSSVHAQHVVTPANPDVSIRTLYRRGVDKNVVRLLRPTCCAMATISSPSSRLPTDGVCAYTQHSWDQGLEREDGHCDACSTHSQAANPQSAPLPALGRCVGTKVETQATATITRPVATPSAAHVLPSTSKMDILHRSDTPAVWARATLYKRKHKDQLTDVGGKLSRVHNFPFCTLCIQPTQGHKKYKRKSFCPVKMMSTSKGLDNKVYSSYEHFTSVVDQL